MNNRRVPQTGGVEDPLAPPPVSTPSRHTSAPPSKRKVSDEENNQTGPIKRNKSSQLLAPATKSKTLKGEKKAGGLIITPLPPTSNAAAGSSSIHSIAPPSRPPSSQRSNHHPKHPPDKLNSILDQPGSSTAAALNKKSKSKGKEKARGAVPLTRQDLEVEEDIRRMNAERERLRVREADAQSQSMEFTEPLLPPPSSIPRRRQSGFASGSGPSTPGGTTIDITQPIPLRDTPTIDRNRAMRGEPVERRRSSLSRRGKRASSSFENTGVIPQPHASVASSNFHKHIDRELPEAHRARHLLVWCASRTSARPGSSSRVDNPTLPPLTSEGVSMLQEVQKEVQKMLTEQRIDTSFSNRIEENGKPQVKPHEQNVRNLKREDDFMRHIDRCKREDEAWTSVIQTYNARQASTMDALTRNRHQSGTLIDWIPPDTSDPLHERELQGVQLARRCKENASRKREGSPLSLRLAEVESKLDRLHSTLHISQQLTKRTTRHLDKRFEVLATALAARSQPPPQPNEISTLSSLVSANPNPPSATGLGAPPDTLSILRALARTDMEHPREMGDAARKAARDVQRVNATPGRSSAGAMGERRLTAVTPRAAPGTPRRATTPRQRGEGADGGGPM
ncbi:hypothetical protein K439DRAFT_1657984 [Ramaria rubella]|nr:hypothetical protein K439DRAFT_1657984 [Ramaria rubella]